MGLISKVSLKNFKCFREKIDLPINQGTYFIGINNAGKTAVLNAVKFFFDSSLFDDESFLNRTTYLAKKGGYNRSEITLTFDLSSVINKALKSKLIKFFSGTNAVIKKSIIFSSDSRQITSFYTIREKDYDFEQIDENIRKLLRSVKIIYIHPQEGRELLLNAQDKLRARLLANWGRGARLSHSIKELQDKWIALREQARSYLSGSLTDSLQKMWPGSEASIDLPKDVKDIVAISDITFKSHTSFPDIELTAQGTGAQATILYLTHFLLDSDRSLHRGEYHPIWLLEEPESFLHADLIAKFAAQMNSELWLRNIQMLVSTHSPIILAASRLGEKSIIWNLINEYRLKEGKGVDEWSPEQIEDIGKIMGDANFHVYFNAAKRGPLIFIEDSRELTKTKFEEAGIPIEKGLNGTSEIARYLEVFLSGGKLSDDSVFFIVDSDKGLDQLKRFIGEESREEGGFKSYKLRGSDTIFLISLPDGFAVEDLFAEYDGHLKNCIDLIWDTHTWKMRSSVPARFAGTCARCKRSRISCLDEAVAQIRNQQEVKDSFWEKVALKDYQIKKQFVEALSVILK